MRRVRFAGITSAAVFALLAASHAAHANSLTMDEGRPFSDGYDDGGMGSGRGLGFLVNESFEMLALAIDLNVEAAELSNVYEFEVYQSPDGVVVGSLLDSVSFQLELGAGYQDQAFEFSFDAGSHYIINFSRVDNANLGDLGTQYSWEDPGTFVPKDYGVLTLLEGFEGAFPSRSNPLLPHMRITFVPEPASYFAIGIAGICSAVWNRRSRGNL